MINGNALSRRATPGRLPGFQDQEDIRAVCVQDPVSEWPTAARCRLCAAITESIDSAGPAGAKYALVFSLNPWIVERVQI
jgi:hypothetical protein